jgi:hypothetical protein
MTKKILAVICLISQLADPAFAGAGTGTADFLKVAPDSRSAALGHTGTADPDNGFAAFHNPALPAASRQMMQVSAGQTQWILNTQISHYAASFRRGDERGAWAMAFSASQWSSPSFQTTDSLGNILGKASFQARTTGLSVSRAWGNWSAGAGVKQITQGFTGSFSARASATAWDAGVFARSDDGRWSAGAALTNMGSAAGLGQAKEDLPAAARAGLSWKPGDGSVAWSAELQHTKEKSLSLGAGMTFFPMKNLAFRAGYDGRVAGAQYAGLTSGVGLRYASFSLDYAFTPFGELGNVQRISATWAWGGGESRPAASARNRRSSRSLDRAISNLRRKSWN